MLSGFIVFFHDLTVMALTCRILGQVISLVGLLLSLIEKTGTEELTSHTPAK